MERKKNIINFLFPVIQSVKSYRQNNVYSKFIYRTLIIINFQVDKIIFFFMKMLENFEI